MEITEPVTNLLNENGQETEQINKMFDDIEQIQQNNFYRVIELLRLIERMTPHQFDLFLQMLTEDGNEDLAEMFIPFRNLAKGKVPYNSNADQSTEK